MQSSLGVIGLQVVSAEVDETEQFAETLPDSRVTALCAPHSSSTQENPQWLPFLRFD